MRGAIGFGTSGATYGANNSQLMYNTMGIMSNLKDEAMKRVCGGSGVRMEKDRPGLTTHLEVMRSLNKPSFMLAPRKVLRGTEMGELQESGVLDPEGLTMYVHTGDFTDKILDLRLGHEGSCEMVSLVSPGGGDKLT